MMKRKYTAIIFAILILSEDSSAFTSNTKVRTFTTHQRENIAILRGGKIHQRKRLTGYKATLSSEDNKEHRGMSIALMSVYFTVMAAKCALPAVLAMLYQRETGLKFPASSMPPEKLMARLLAASTLAIAAGKVLLGPVIDSVGGIRSLQVALVGLASLLLLISQCQSFAVFSAAWILIDFIFSSCWASCMNAIVQVFPSEKWTAQIGNLAAAARAGNAMAFTMFAGLLRLYQSQKQPWRVIFAFAGGLQIFSVGLLTRNVRKETNKLVETDKPTVQESLQTLAVEAKTFNFWLHLISRSGLMVFASFLLFVPTLQSQVYQASAHFSAQTGSIYAIGCLLGIFVGSPIYSRVLTSAVSKARFLAGLLGVASMSSAAQLGHAAGFLTLNAKWSAVSLFLWGLTFAIPFYRKYTSTFASKINSHQLLVNVVPASLYALERGGTKSSATIADVFDIVGFGLLAFFNGYVAGIPHASRQAWVKTFSITTLCALTSLVTQAWAVRRDSGESSNA